MQMLEDMTFEAAELLPAGTAGIDAGLTLTKVARADGERVELTVQETAAKQDKVASAGDRVVGITGSRAPGIPGERFVRVQEIEAAARGVIGLAAAHGQPLPDEFLLALLGTGTAFAAVRGLRVSHLGGTPLGGGSFGGIARRIDPSLAYRDMLDAAARGDRRVVDTMVSEAYPEGIGRIGPDLTAAHLASSRDGSVEDVLAALLNLHGENIGQIAASRARIAGLTHIAVAGGFVHNNALLVASLTGMISMFGVKVELTPAPAFAGAVGAGLLAAEAAA